MARHSFEQQIKPAESTLSSLQHPIDQLIALSGDIDSPDVAIKAFTIIEGMKSAQSATEQYTQLAALSQLGEHIPEAFEVVSDTAEILLHEIEEGKLPPKSVGLSLVWSAVHTWDNTRDAVTANLCVQVLNNFKGEGQAALVHAYILARDKELPFEEALDDVLGIAA